MTPDDEIDLVILDELATGARSLEELQLRCDLGVGELLDNWGKGPGPARGPRCVDRLLRDISVFHDGPERFAERVERLVVSGWLRLGPEQRYELTAAGDEHRRAQNR